MLGLDSNDDALRVDLQADPIGWAVMVRCHAIVIDSLAHAGRGVDGRIGLAHLRHAPLLAVAMEVALVGTTQQLAVAAVPTRVAAAALSINANAMIGASAVLVLNIRVVGAMHATRGVDGGPRWQGAPEEVGGEVYLHSAKGLTLEKRGDETVEIVVLQLQTLQP